MKTKLILILLLAFSAQAFAQNIDEERMNRDMEVAKNILQSLLRGGDNYAFWGRSVESSYIEDYGVVFTLPTNAFSSFVVAPRIQRDDQVIIADPNVTGSSDEENEDSGKELKESVFIFLVDYADLIGQLKPDEKIMVHAKSENNIYGYSYIIQSGGGSLTVGGQNSGFSAEVSKKDVSSYRQGNISRDQMRDKVVFHESKPKEVEQDLELLGSIVRRLYSPDLSKTFFTSRTPRYEKLEGFGVIYYLDTYSSYENDDLYRMPVLNRDDVTTEERIKTIEELFPLFEDDFKSMLIEYGRTVKSLDEDEVILFKVKSTKCDGCAIPKSIDFSVTKSVLTQYDQRKLSLEAAKKQVKVQKHFD